MLRRIPRSAWWIYERSPSCEVYPKGSAHNKISNIMKKAFLTIALAAFAFVANAQFIISGNIGFSNHGATSMNDLNTAESYVVPGSISNTIAFSPTFGYQFNDKMQVGISLTYSYSYSKDFNNAGYVIDHQNYEGWKTTSYTRFAIAPYFRYNLMNWNKLTLFLQAQAAFGFTPRKNYHEFSTEVTGHIDQVDKEYESNTKSTDFELSITPGLNYSLGQHASLDLYIDLATLAYYYNKSTTYAAGEVSNRYTYHDFTFGCKASAQTLVNHLSLFRLGFNYAF